MVTSAWHCARIRLGSVARVSALHITVGGNVRTLFALIPCIASAMSIESTAIVLSYIDS